MWLEQREQTLIQALPKVAKQEQIVPQLTHTHTVNWTLRMVIHTRTIFDSRKSFDNSKDGNVPQLLLKDERQTVDNAQGIGFL